MPGRMEETGRIGQNRYGGTFYEEFLPELRGTRGVKVFREMSENDDICGAVLFAVETLIRQAEWNVEPGGGEADDLKAAEFVEGCMDDMAVTWTDTVSEILSFLPFGWSAHEIVYKRRAGNRRDPRLHSKFADGLIGWQKLPPRAQETLWEWEYDEGDNLVAMHQMPPPGGQILRIPAEKLLLFRTKSRKDNPEGRSILRNAYRPWYFKRRIQEIEGIGVERDLAGLPVLTPPEGTEIWNTEDPQMVEAHTRAQALVSNIRRDAMEGIVKPFGWQLELLSTGGRRQMDTNAIIERYDARMAMTVLADFVLLGHQQVGSFALSSDKTELFSMAIGTYMDIICEVFNNKAIPDLMRLNGGHFSGMSGLPRLTHGDVETVNLQELGAFLSNATASGALTPDDTLERFVRRLTGLPERDEDELGGIPLPGGGQGEEEPGGSDAKELEALAQAGEEEGQAARKRLGRED